MANDPGDDDRDPTPDDSGDNERNPFKGTPFEQFFEQLGGAGGLAGGLGNLGAIFGTPGAGGAGMPALSALFGQFQAMLQPHDGPLNWEVATDMARRQVAQAQDPSPTQRQQEQVSEA